MKEEYIDIENEFCAGNLVTDQRRRFKIKDDDIIEIEPLVHWQNLTYVGGYHSIKIIKNKMKL